MMHEIPQMKNLLEVIKSGLDEAEDQSRKKQPTRAMKRKDLKRMRMVRGVQNFGVSVPHWKKRSFLGPHIKYIMTCNHKKNLTMF